MRCDHHRERFFGHHPGTGRPQWRCSDCQRVRVEGLDLDDDSGLDDDRTAWDLKPTWPPEAVGRSNRKEND